MVALGTGYTASHSWVLAVFISTDVSPPFRGIILWWPVVLEMDRAIDCHMCCAMNEESIVFRLGLLHITLG